MSDTEMEVDTPPADTSQDKDASQEGQKGKQGFEVIHLIKYLIVARYFNLLSNIKVQEQFDLRLSD